MSTADEGMAGRTGGGKLIVAVLAADAAVLALLGFKTHPDVLRFETVTVDAVVHGLSVLVFVALIVERALEVWLTPFRGPDSDRLKHQIREREEAGDGAGAEVGGKGRASEHRRRLLEHRLETRRLASSGA